MENNIIKVWIENDKIYIETDTGDIRNHPLSAFPRLNFAPKELLEKFTLSPYGIHWEEIDEDLSFDGFFHYSNDSSILQHK